jgi:DNA-3-methyladenine glycosylase II
LYTEAGFLTPTAPFDFDQSLKFLGAFGPTKNEQTVSPGSLTKAVCIDGQAIVFQISSTGTTEEPRLAYTLLSAQSIGESTKNAVIERMIFFLSLQDDLRPFYRIGREDPDFAPIIEHLYGYHQVKFLTPFENACWAVLTQRNPMNIAQKMKQALIERFGSSLVVNGTTYWAFPEPIQVAVADESELMSLVPNGRRAEYLSAIARSFGCMNSL